VCQCICQPKLHDQILIEAVSSRESCLGDILGTNLDLMISGVEINLREHLGALPLVDQTRGQCGVVDTYS
jgi:hypothetical protein